MFPEFDVWNEYARRHLGVAGDWHWFSIEAIDPGAVLVEGAVAPLFTRGPRKGRRNWRRKDASTIRRFVVSAADADAVRGAWELDTGLCHNCSGSGQEFARWSKDHGTETRACKRCAGSGNAPQSEVE